jgi:hypothetical protein
MFDLVNSSFCDHAVVVRVVFKTSALANLQCPLNARAGGAEASVVG